MSPAMRIALLVIAILNFTCAQRNIYVWNSRLFIDGAEFLVKGVDYSPSPIGLGTVNLGTGYGGTGFCSAKPTQYGEWKSACYDSDYFDGSPWPQNKSVQGFMPLWQRDFPAMKAYGVNTIRMYNTNPTSLAASKTYTNLFSSPTGKDHSQFMALAASFGFKIAYPLYMYNNDYASLPAAQFLRFLRWQIDEVGNSSSLLYWVLGNEQAWTWDANQVNNTVSQAKFNDYTGYIKRYTYSKWNRWIPVSMSIQWNYGFFQTLMPQLHLDFFSANIFTTSIGGYDQLMSLGTSSFEGFGNASCKYSKPFLITEFGTTASIGRVYVNNSVNLIWFNILRNIQFGLLGGIYFEHTDEPGLGKGKDFGAVQINITRQGSLTSNMTDVFIPDTVTLKQAYYDLVNGGVNGTAYNYNIDEWKIIGRRPYTVSNVPDRCNMYAQCPGTVAGSPMCSGNGMCNRTLGRCSCMTGWTGSDCSTPACPNSCSGRGICSTLVSPPECFCNPPYYGLSCQSTPPASPTVCPGNGPSGCTYGNGVCNNRTWTCTCWPGWTGLDCAVTDLNGLSSTTSSSSFSISTTSTSTFGVTTSTSSTTALASTSGTVSVAQTTSSSVTVASSVSTTSASSTTAAASTLAVSSSSSASVGTTTSASSSNTVASSTSATSVAASSSTSVGATSSASTSNTVASSASTSATTSVATSTGSTSAVSASTTKAATSTTTAAAQLSSSSSTSAATTATSSAASSTSTVTSAVTRATSSTSLTSSSSAVASSTSATSSSSSSSSSSTTSSVATSSTAATTAASSTAASTTTSSTSRTVTASTSTATVATTSTRSTSSSSTASSTTGVSTTASSTTAASSSSTATRAASTTAASSTTTGPSSSSSTVASSTSSSSRVTSSSSASSATSSRVASTTATGTTTGSESASTTTGSASTTATSTTAVSSTASTTASSTASSSTASTESSTTIASTASSTTAASTASTIASTSTATSTSSSSTSSSTTASSASVSSTGTTSASTTSLVSSSKREAISAVFILVAVLCGLIV